MCKYKKKKKTESRPRKKKRETTWKVVPINQPHHELRDSTKQQDREKKLTKTNGTRATLLNRTFRQNLMTENDDDEQKKNIGYICICIFICL